VKTARYIVAAGFFVAAVMAVVAVASSSGERATAPQVGSEGVPVLHARPLAAASSPAPGQTIDGIGCGSTEQLRYHVHAHLTIFVNGKQRAVPAGIGIGPPLQTLNGFVSGGACFALLHTHAADGIIHVESPHAITFVLDQFFAVWQQPLDSDDVGPAAGQVTAFVNGRRYPGDPSAIPLSPHAQIQLDVGRPVIAPKPIRFPVTL
jgi:hypothetical protein